MSSQQAFVASPTPWLHPSYQAVATLVESLTVLGARPVFIPRLLGRIVHRLPWFPHFRSKRTILVPMMGEQWSSLGATYAKGKPVVFAWDVWESGTWAEELNRFHVPLAIVTSRASQQLLERSEYRGRVLYVADAIRVGDFIEGKPLAHRENAVLELGRRHDAWHQATIETTSSNGIVHLFEEARGKVIFPTRVELVHGLAESAVSVCFPRSMTDPSGANGVESLTQRYLESMASGCLILGHSPADLTALFGYNPLIEVDWDDPAKQLLSILSNIDSFQALVERNLCRLREVGDWSQRCVEILGHLTALDA